MEEMEEQSKLLELPERPAVQGEDGVSAGKVIPKLRTVNRAQMVMANISVEKLIPADHKTRAIWESAGRLELDRFEESLKTQAGSAGRAAWDPRLLVSVWVYAYSEGIGSAREIERCLEYEPGFQWLCGLSSINHHTLSDFRVKQKKPLSQ
jgi:transposase